MSELILLEKLDPAVVYSGGLDSVLEKLAEEAKAIAADISTEKGRKEIASNAYKVARSKTLLDDMGKKLGEEAKAKLDAINADRKKARDFCDALKDDVRKPLTDWENAEKQRIEKREADIAEIISAGNYTLANWQTLPMDAMRERLLEIKGEKLSDWEEFEARAQEVIAKSSEQISDAITRREKHDAEQAELARLRAEAEERRKQDEERQRIEREEKMKAEVAEKARREAEEKAAAEIRAADERAASEAAARKAAEEKAERDRVEAAARAEREKQAAVDAERQRAAAVAKAEADATAKREADIQHKAKINNEVLAAFAALDCVLGEAAAKWIVVAIASGKIPHVKISY